MSAPAPPLQHRAAAALVSADDLQAECQRLAAALRAAEAERERTQLQLQRYVEDLLLVNRQRKAALEAAAQAALAQTRFLGEVSDDLRGPLTSIVGFAELLARDPDSAHRADFADRMRHAALRLNGLVDRLIDVARHGGPPAAADIEPVELTALLGAAIAAAQPAAAALGVAITLQPLPPGLQPLAVDAGRAAQAITVLLEDLARRQPGGTLQLAQSADAGGHPAQLMLMSTGALAGAGLADTGAAAPAHLTWMMADALLESVGATLAHRALPEGGFCVTVNWTAARQEHQMRKIT